MRFSKFTSVAVVGALAYVLAGEAFAQSSNCTTTAANFTESFSSTTYRDDALTSASGWGLGAVRLALKGNSFNAEAKSIGEKVYVAGTGDFDGDGWVDLVAVVLSPNRLHFLKNLGINADGSHRGFFNGGSTNSVGWKAQVIDAAPPGFNEDGPAVYAGDFDGDGDPDFMYMKTNDQARAGEIDNAYAYRNDGLNAGGYPIFTRLNFSAFFKASGASYHRTTTWGTVIDWDKDGQDDFICTSSHGTVNEVLLFRSKTKGQIDFAEATSIVPDIGLIPPFAMAGKAFNAGGCQTAPNKSYSQGGSAIAVGDLDGDGDYDVVVGSVNEKNLKYWRNDGSDVFTKMPDIIWGNQGLYVGGAPTFIIIGDFDGDGDNDIVPGRDGYYCNGPQGTAWFFANDGTGTSFTQRTTPLLNAGADLDFGIKLYIDENIKYPNLNKSTEMTLDLIAADGNNTGQYYPVLGVRSNVYNISNRATSRVIDTLDNNGNAIVSATMSGLTQTLPTGTSISYSVSNDNGATWETLTPEEVFTNGTAKTHTFTHFGSDFRFRAELFAPESSLVGEEASLKPGAKVTPILSGISFQYNYVSRREYSRSNLAYANNVNVGTSTNTPTGLANLVFSSTFFYPGYEGTLRAFRESNALQTTSEANNDLNETVVKSGQGSALQWDAGELLKQRSAGSRTLYTSLPTTGTDTTSLTRLDFTAGNAPKLAATMATDSDSASRVISFVRAGMNAADNTKLYDVGHSSPVYVGPPIDNANDPSLSADNYANFVTQQASRVPVVYIGSNSGMVHAFNAQTGAELWAYVPYNLLAKLKTQMITNDTGNSTYEHQYMVDGAVIVRDVYDRDSSRWRTVLIAGEALGTGRGDNNYYFGIDVTDPANPIPMWEYTDGWNADGMACTGKYVQNVCTTTTPQTCSNSCADDNHEFIPYTASGGIASTSGYIAMEAESFGTNKPLDTASTWNALTTPLGYYHTGYMQSARSTLLANCTNFTTCGAVMSYPLAVTTAGDYVVMFRYSVSGNSATSVRYQIGSTEQTLSLPGTNDAWTWIVGTKTATLPANDYNLQVSLVRNGVRIDKIIVAPNGSKAPTDQMPPQTCATQCVSGTPVTTCADKPFSPSAESFECGTGSGFKCCADTSSQGYYCAPVGQACSDVDTVLGQTWSQPVVAPVRVNNNRRWLAMFASGYNNRAGVPAAVGRSVYALDIVTGRLTGQWNYNDIAYNNTTNPSTIDNTIPGGISVFDFTTSGADETPDGYADVAYVGDLEGRVWKIDLSRNGSASTNTTVPLTSWPTCVMFDAGDPTLTGSRDWAPVITTPAVTTIASDTSPRRPIVYFGTGGDDRAPSSPPRLGQYRFYAIKDTVTCGVSSTPQTNTAINANVVFSQTDNPNRYQWIVGDGRDLKGNTLAISTSEGTTGQRYWSDPVIFNNSIVYFASLGGSIESVNPCDNLADSSLLFGYAIRDIRDSDGRQISAGTSTVPASLNSGAYYRSASKIRRAVLVAGQAPTAGVAQPPSATGGTSAAAAGTQIFIQTFDGNIRAIKPPTVKDSNTIRVLRWREIPLY